jgi:hypothetical protein
MEFAAARNRTEKLKSLARFLLFVLCLKILLSIIYEFRFYFPPNFEANFLIGRKSYFFGSYSTAFYVHIVGGPIAIVIGFVLMLSGRVARFRKQHRWLGRVQGVIVLVAVLPSGLLMATRSVAGPIAGWGFATVAILTAISMVMAIRRARSRQFKIHQRWATRSFILLCSPLLFRVISGVTIVSNVESPMTYRLNAWLSWLIPLIVYEWSWRFRERSNSNVVKSARSH